VWEIPWLISFIPDWVLIKLYYLFLVSGLVLYFGSKLFKQFPFRLVPFLGQYPFLAEILGVVLLVSSIYLLGGYGTEMAWRAKVEAAQAKVAIAEKASADANDQLKNKIVKEVQVIHDKQIVIKKEIQINKISIDKECRLDPSVVNILNDAAQNPYAKKGSVTVQSGNAK
jgi:hypothetical protein